MKRPCGKCKCCNSRWDRLGSTRLFAFIAAFLLGVTFSNLV